jgi:phage replication O-like protein O
MASPQVENGFTKIANELLEELPTLEISGRAFRCLLVIIRETYGWRRKEAAISNYKFSKLTGILPHHVCAITKELESAGIITRTPSPSGTIISLNKDHDKWNQGITENGNTENGNTKIGNPENGNETITENGNTTITENGNTGCPTTHDFMRPAESLKKVKEIKEIKEGETARKSSPSEKDHGSNQLISPAIKTSVSDYSNRSVLAKALGKLEVSEAELVIWQALEGLNCKIEDVESARTAKGKNNLSYLKNIVCEFRDERIRKMNDPNRPKTNKEWREEFEAMAKR